MVTEYKTQTACLEYFYVLTLQNEYIYVFWKGVYYIGEEAI